MKICMQVVCLNNEQSKMKGFVARVASHKLQLKAESTRELQ